MKDCPSLQYTSRSSFSSSASALQAPTPSEYRDTSLHQPNKHTNSDQQEDATGTFSRACGRWRPLVVPERDLHNGDLGETTSKRTTDLGELVRNNHGRVNGLNNGRYRRGEARHGAAPSKQLSETKPNAERVGVTAARAIVK